MAKNTMISNEIEASGEEKTKTDIALEPIEHKDGGTQMLEAAKFDEDAGEPNTLHLSSIASENHSTLIMVVVALFAIAGILMFVLLANRPDETQTTQQQEQTASAPKRAHYQNLMTTDTPMDIRPDDHTVIINGVFFDILKSQTPLGSYPLLTDHDNVIAVYAENRVPYITRLAKSHNYQEDPISIELMPDDFYQRSEVLIKAPANVNPEAVQIMVNGQVIPSAKSEQRITCLSGFPYFIQVNAKDKGSHLHVFWPTHTQETVQLPDLTLKNNADVITLLTLQLPKSFEQDNSLKVQVTAEGHTYHSPGIMHIAKGEWINVSVKKNGRYPMELAFDSTPFGSIFIDGYLQPSSKGVAHVHFSKQSDPSVKVCFRRASETTCTKEAMTYVSSGKWELLAYREKKDGTRVILKDQPYEILKADHDYTMTVDANASNFTYKITEKRIQ